MDKHITNKVRQHLELLMKEIQLNRTVQLAQSTEIRRLQGINQSLQGFNRSLQNEVCFLQNEVRSLKNAASWTNQDVTVLKKSHEDMKHNHQQTFQQVQDLENSFKVQQKDFQNFKQDCAIMYENISLLKIIPPLKFIVHNIGELRRTREGQETSCFYTECRRHKLKLAIFPEGRNGTEGQFVAVWVYRINGFGIAKEHLPEKVKINLSLELVNQLSMTNNTRENHAIQLDAVLKKDETDAGETLICKKNDFIEINQLDYQRRDTFTPFTAKFTQYIMNNCLIFLVKYAGEAI